MHFFSVISVCLLCSSLAAAGPLPRDSFRKLQFRQVAPFKNTTSTADSAAATIDVVPVALTQAPVDTATTTATTSSSTELSTASTATTLSTSGFANTTLISSSTTATTAQDAPVITSNSPTATAAGDGANAAQTAIGASQTAIISNLSGFVPSGSIVAGTGDFSRTTLVSANSNTDASADSKPTTGTQVFPFEESLTNTPGAISTTAEAPFTFSSDPVTPTTISTQTTNAPVAITVTGAGVVVPVTPSFFTSASPLPTTTEAPTATDAASMSAENLRLAHEFNDMYATLTPESICAPNKLACIDGKFATCVDGRYTLKGCSSDSKLCYAMPLTESPGVVVKCTDIETAESILGLPNSLSVTIGSVPVVVPSTTAEVVQATSIADAVPTTTAAEAVVTVAAAQPSDSNEGQADEVTTVLHRTIISTITIAVSDFAPSTVAPAADTPTAVAIADGSGSIISVVPVAAAAAGGSGGKEEGLVTVTITRSVTVTEQFTITRAGVTATVTVG